MIWLALCSYSTDDRWTTLDSLMGNLGGTVFLNENGCESTGYGWFAELLKL